MILLDFDDGNDEVKNTYDFEFHSLIDHKLPNSV